MCRAIDSLPRWTPAEVLVSVPSVFSIDIPTISYPRCLWAITSPSLFMVSCLRKYSTPHCSAVLVMVSGLQPTLFSPPSWCSSRVSFFPRPSARAIPTRCSRCLPSPPWCSMCCSIPSLASPHSSHEPCSLSWE